MVATNRSNFRLEELVDFVTNLEIDFEISDDEINVGYYSANNDESGVRDL